MRIIGHRGACFDYPENTLVSVEQGWRQGADAVEIDVHLSADGRMMVMHDANTFRTTGEDLTIAQADSLRLRELDAGLWKGGQFAGQRVPFLEEVLSLVPHGRLLMVEIKCGPEILPGLVECLMKTGSVGKVNIISFNLEAVSAFKKLLPEVPTLWLRGSRTGDPYPQDLVRETAEHGLDGLSLQNTGVDRAIVDALRGAGQQVWAWTVNDPSEAARLRDLGIDYLTSDRPGWMREQLESMENN